MRTEQEMLLAFRKAGFEHAVTLNALGQQPSAGTAQQVRDKVAANWPEFDESYRDAQYQEIAWALCRYRVTIASSAYRLSENPGPDALVLTIHASDLEGLEVIRAALRKTDRAFDWSQTIHTHPGCQATFFIESRPDERWPGIQEEDQFSFSDESS